MLSRLLGERGDSGLIRCWTRNAAIVPISAIVVRGLWALQPLSAWIGGLLHRREFMPGTINTVKTVAREVTGLKGEQAETVFLMAMPNCLLNTFVYIL